MYGSVQYDSIADAFRCEICGKWFKGLGYHIAKQHKITVREYNKRFGYDLNTTYLSKKCREIKRKHVIENKTYKNLEKGKPYRFKKGQGPVDPFYKRSKQTRHRLRTLRASTAHAKKGN